MTSTMKILAASATIAMMGGLSAAAFAEGAQQITVTTAGVQEMNIVYADLRLEEAAGMQTLERRIVQAAKRVCNQSNGRQTVAEASRYKACFQAAKADAMKGVAAIVEARAAKPINLASH
jgi:UrcA family protein